MMVKFFNSVIRAFGKLTGLMRPVSEFYRKNSDIIRPVVVLTVICLTVSFALSVTNMITEGSIRKIEEKMQFETRAALVADAAKYSEVNDPSLLQHCSSFFEAKDAADNVMSYIITTSAKGYGGDVSVMTAISADKKIIGVSILNVSDETPGLGQKVKEESFYSQLIGLTSGIVVQKNSAKPEDNEINAVSGATITSTAVKNAVEDAFKALELHLASAVQATDNTLQEVQ